MKQIAQFLVFVLLGGCVGSNPTRLYVLRSSDTAAALGVETNPPKSSAGEKSLSIRFGVQPVELPGYLDRSQIVSGVSENQLAISNLDEWAEPLKDSVTRLVMEELIKKLGSLNVLALPADDDSQLSYKLAVRVIRFETTPQGEAVLEARWYITSVKDKKQVWADYGVFKERVAALPAGGDKGSVSSRNVLVTNCGEVHTYQSEVSALNAVFLKLCQRLVEACNSMAISSQGRVSRVQ